MSKTLLADLEPIRSKKDLENRMPQLKRHFDRIASLALKVNSLVEKSGESPPELTAEDHQLSDRLRAELSRICLIDGARELVEATQQSAYERLE